MGKIYYRYSTMNSSKTANLIMIAHNYSRQGKEVFVLKPSLDTRSAKGMIESRAGLSMPCVDIGKEEDIFELYMEELKRGNDYHAILVDECSFLTAKQVRELVRVTETFDVPILCYGLKNSYVDGELFEGSAALLYYADKIEEIKNTCQCGRKATMNLRVIDGQPVYHGDLINCGDVEAGSDYYISVCRKHYYNAQEILD